MTKTGRFIFMAALALGSVLPLRATVFTVTKTADTLDSACDHDCSLREAVSAANNNFGLDMIVLGPGVYELTRTGKKEDESTHGDLDVRDALVILGAGADRTVIDGGGIDRVLQIRPSLGTEIYDVTVRNGRAEIPTSEDGMGGGIKAVAPLTLVRCVVTGNHADEAGGGIHSVDSLTIRDTTISENLASYGGGLVAVQFRPSSKIRLTNVTISGNRADSAGGAGVDYFDTEMTHVTITRNEAEQVGGLAFNLCGCPAFGEDCCSSDHFVLSRSLIAGNTDRAGTPDCLNFAANFLSPADGFNLIGVGDGCFARSTDLAGSLAEPLAPGLSPLGNHGGPTPTHVPREDSLAVDLAPAGSCAAADQRGQPRPADGDGDFVSGCDAGAVERSRGCEADEETLCLGVGSRFQVTVHWTTPTQSGSGKAVPLTLDTGTFWFFDPANLELTVKVLDGCGVNGRFWVFLSGLTDVGVEVEVEDTLTKKLWTHEHQAGSPLQSRLDTSALDSCLPTGVAQ